MSEHITEYTVDMLRCPLSDWKPPKMSLEIKEDMPEVTPITEAKLQQDCVTWFRNTYPQFRGLLFAVPNGGLRNKREAAKLKYQGVVAGIPDLVFCFVSNKATFFELKTDKGRLSKDQQKVIGKLDAHGFRTHIIRDLDTFQEIVESIVN